MSKSDSSLISQEVPRRKHKKRKLYNWHIWLGFNLAFLTTLLLATGTIATVSNEIDWLIQNDMRVTPDGEKVLWGEIEAKVKAAANPEHMLTTLSEGESDYFAYRATFLRPDGTRYHIHINQWTGEITGTTPFLTVQRFFRDLHRYFFMPSFIGLPIVSSLAVVLMISLYTGLKTTGRIKKAAFRIRKNKDTRVFLSDLHKMSGIWSTWFIVIVAITAMWYLVEFGFLVGGKGFEPPRPSPTVERMQEFGDVLDMVTADKIIESATTAFPHWRPVQILYPRSHKQAITVLGYTDDMFVRSRANRVFLDPEDGSIIKVQKSSEINTTAYLNEMADPLHFGNWGKLTTKLIWFFFGALLTGMSVTGVLMTYRRLKKAHVSKAQIKTFPILLIVTVAGIFYVDGQLGDTDTHELIAQSVNSYGELTLKTELRRSTSNKYDLKVTVQHACGYPIIQSVEVTDTDSQTYTLRQKTFSSTTVFTKTLSLSDEASHSQLTLRVQFASGMNKQFMLNI
jgi:uncharacterized iron-regulated membrane protein